MFNIQGNSFSFSNMGFINDWLPIPSSPDVDMSDDPSTSFEDDEVSLSEKTRLIDPKTLPIKVSDLRRHTESKTKKWLKSASSMTFKKLSSSKKKKLTAEK